MRQITAEDIELATVDVEAALERPKYFWYNGDRRDEMFRSWSLGRVVRHRDSGVLARSNARVLQRRLEQLVEEGTIEEDWEFIEASHSLVGWVEHLSYRVLDEQGEVTKVARFLELWFDYLDHQHPIADEADFTELEMEATEENVKFAGEILIRRHDLAVPDDWLDQVIWWFHENDAEALQANDDGGAMPRDERMEAAFRGCKFLPTPIGES